MADRIANLSPSQQEQPSEIDVNIMRDVFGDGKAVAKSLQLKKIIIPAILFVVLSLPIVDNLLKSVVPDLGDYVREDAHLLDLGNIVLGWRRYVNNLGFSDRRSQGGAPPRRC